MLSLAGARQGRTGRYGVAAERYRMINEKQLGALAGALFILPAILSAATLVQSNATESNLPSNSSQSVGFSSNVTAGNTLMVFVQYYSASVTTTVTDNCSDTFTEIAGGPKANG